MKKVSLFILSIGLGVGMLFNLSMTTAAPSLILKVGEQGFVPISTLRPTQVRYSSENVRDKIKKAKGLIYDNGNSVFELNANDTIPVILGPKGLYYLLDGHHSVLASIQLKAKTMPVEVKVDLSHFTEANTAFWVEMVNHHYAYLLNIDGSTAIPPRSFADLKDDPWRYFAAITTLKCTPGKATQPTQEWRKYGSTPITIKAGRGVYFQEFVEANVLYSKGFVFNYGDQLHKDRFNQQIKGAREILTQSPIKGVPVLPADQGELEKKVQEFCGTTNGLLN